MMLKKIRSYRIGPFAIFDFAASYVGAWYLAPYLKPHITRKQALYWIIPLGIVVHHVFSIKTPLNNMVLGPDYNLPAQAVVAGMIIAGFKDK